MTAKRIMIQGTMSGVGKSLITAALCRIFHQDGYRTAPFKSQNMALNSFIVQDGGEMGRAQALQAQAAGIAPDVRMNPVLLKPSSDTGSQVIVNGQVLGNYRAAEYFCMKKSLVPQIMQAYESLAAENNIIVIEGAGSPAEINLKQEDIVNMGLAKMVDAPVLLVGNIDPGGVFAQLYGTIALLEEEERARIAGTVINKFRGDPGILKPGLEMLEDLTRVPVLGVIPYVALDLDDEDSLSERLGTRTSRRTLDIAVIRVPRLSNFTDFTPLELHPDIGVRYIAQVRDLGSPDLVILPGTKNTMGDLLWLRQSGIETAILRLHGQGTPVLGICGGYQMLGETLEDPWNVEHGGTVNGMGLLNIRTVFSREKTQVQTSAAVTAGPFAGAKVEGYQIHMGQTQADSLTPLCTLTDGSADGAAEDNVFGTYLHGLFDTGEATERLAAWLLERKGLTGVNVRLQSHAEYQEQQLDLLADTVRRNLDMDTVYRVMGMEPKKEDGGKC